MQRRIPLWLKVAYTAFMAVLVPVYWNQYGPQNFLWFCDVALFLTLAALWWESPLLTSLPAVGIILPQLAWNVDFFVRLFKGSEFYGLAEYMFNPKYPLFLRALSSFHGWLPFLLVWMVWKLGYNRRALPGQTLLCWLFLALSFLLTDLPPAPAEDETRAVNVNWVFGFGDTVETMMSPELYLGAQMLLYPLVIYLPTHFLLLWLVPARSAAALQVNQATPDMVRA